MEEGRSRPSAFRSFCRNPAPSTCGPPAFCTAIRILHAYPRPGNGNTGPDPRTGHQFCSLQSNLPGLLSNWKPSEDKTDFRNMLPRFQGDAYDSNKVIADALALIAKEKGCTLAQLSLAWVCAQAENIIPNSRNYKNTKPRFQHRSNTGQPE